MTTTTYTGSVTLYSSRPGFPGPKTVENIRFTLEPDAAPNVFRVTSFDDVTIEDVETPLGKKRLIARMVPPGSATVDSATGSVSIEAEFRFKLSVPALFPSRLALVVSTGSASMPSGDIESGEVVVPGKGAVRLVGASSFEGGFLEDDLCGVVLEGDFEPPLT